MSQSCELTKEWLSYLIEWVPRRLVNVSCLSCGAYSRIGYIWNMDAIKNCLVFKIPILLFSVTNRNVCLYYCIGPYRFIGAALICVNRWPFKLSWIWWLYPSLRRTDLSAAPGKDSLGNVFENDAKDIVPRLSPDQNDTAAITSGLSFKQNRYLSYNLGQKCQEKWKLLWLVSR